jgi:hypothetical protein
LSTKTASKQAKLPLNPSNSQEPHQPHKKHKTLSLSLPPGNLSNSATVVVSFCLCKSLQLVVAATRSKKQEAKEEKEEEVLPSRQNHRTQRTQIAEEER